MDKAQKYFFNALLLCCSSLVMRAISVAFNAHISSYIGSAGMGLLTLTAGVYGFAITFATSGINLAVVRLVSASLAKESGRVGKIMRSAILYCLFFSIIASLFLFSLADFIGFTLLGDGRVVPSIKLFSFSLIPISISSAINGYFYAVRRVYKNVISQFCENFIRIGIVSYLLIIFSPIGLDFACVAVIGGGVISEISSALISGFLYVLDRRLHPEKSPSSRQGELTNICSISLPVAISAYFRSALSTLEHLAIPWGLRRCGLDFEKSIASYGILHGMVVPLLLFPSAVLSSFSSLLIPELSSAYETGNNSRIRYIVSRAFGVSLLFSIGISGAFVAFSHEIGIFLYSSSEAGEYIKLLAPLIPLMYLDGTVDAMLKGLGQQLYTMRVNITDSIISILLIVALLPKMGISGYVIIIFVTETLNTSLSIIKLLNLTSVKTPITKWILKPLVTIILSTLITRFLFDFGIMTSVFGLATYGKGYVIWEIVFCALFYLIISRIVGAISKEDISLGKRIIHFK